MKRMLIRLSMLTTVVVLGLIAIAQAQRGLDNPNVAAPGSLSGGTVEPGLNDDVPPPVTLGAETDTTVGVAATGAGGAESGHDPFSGRASDAAAAPPETHPLAADLRIRDASDAEDDFPSADEVLSTDSPDERYGPQDTLDRSDEPQPSEPRQLAQAPPRDTPTAAGDPSPPATLPRYGSPDEERPLYNYNPIRGIDDGGPPADERPVADRYTDSLTGEEQPTAADPFPDERRRTNSANPTGNAPPADSDARLPTDTARDGTGVPGARQLEGQQVPTLLIHKVAPTEIQVGRPAIFEIRVRNTGTVPAHGVEVYDTLPKGTRLMATTPLADSAPRGTLVWELGTLDPGSDVTVSVQLMPTAEGEIGSVASVRFSAEASVRTIATKPELAVDVVMAESVMIGEQLPLKIRISNSGSGVATNVVMEELVPELFDHVKGSALEYEIGDLQPGETREVPLTLSAVQAGFATNVLSVRADGNLFDDARNEIQVVAPALAVDIQGPRRRFLDREATYNISISNPGTATAREIELVTYLPPGMQFVDANHQGQFDPASRAVYWLLEELPPAEAGTVTLTAVPTEAGVQKLRAEGTAQQGLSDQKEQEVTVEGVAAILFQVIDVEDPIEAGGETAYEVRVVNQGSKAATNIAVEAILPAEMKALAADGPTRYTLDGQRVVFEPLPRLAPKADTTYLIRAQALTEGDLRLMVRLRTDDMQSPVTKEESTRVFSDQ